MRWALSLAFRSILSLSSKWAPFHQLKPELKDAAVTSEPANKLTTPLFDLDTMSARMVSAVGRLRVSPEKACATWLRKSEKASTYDLLGSEGTS